MKSRKVWIGRWLVGVALVHTVFGLVEGGAYLLDIVKRGMFNTVTQAEPLTGMVVWFMLFGAPLALLGMAVHAQERTGHVPGARAVGIGAALTALAAVILMPASGFWLLFPPAIGLMRRPSL